MPIPTFEQLISGFKQAIEKAGKNPDDFHISTLESLCTIKNCDPALSG